DARNWSCAYDAALTVLWNMLQDYGSTHFQHLAMFYPALRCLQTGFEASISDLHLLEVVRDAMRDKLSSLHPQRFPRTGTMECAIFDVVSTLLTSSTPFGCSTYTCPHCSFTSLSHQEHLSSATFSVYPFHWDQSEPRPTVQTTTDCLRLVFNYANGPACRSCLHPMSSTTVIEHAPPMFALEIQRPDSAGQPSILLQNTCSLSAVSGDVLYSLIGIVYAGGRHFTSRYFARDHSAWYHDSAETGRSCI
ncbi:uncharacterized protein LAESUDRAFT_601345, partial [Laetiporus sulphureus 93-53]